MNASELETIAWDLLMRSIEEAKERRVRFATGDLSLVRGKGHRFERLSPPTPDNPRGLWRVV